MNEVKGGAQGKGVGEINQGISVAPPLAAPSTSTTEIGQKAAQISVVANNAMPQPPSQVHFEIEPSRVSTADDLNPDAASEKNKIMKHASTAIMAIGIIGVAVSIGLGASGVGAPIVPFVLLATFATIELVGGAAKANQAGEGKPHKPLGQGQEQSPSFTPITPNPLATKKEEKKEEEDELENLNVRKEELEGKAETDSISDDELEELGQISQKLDEMKKNAKGQRE